MKKTALLRPVVCAALALFFGASLPRALAEDVTFIGPGSGANWFTPGNWSGTSGLPTTTGTATVDSGRDALLAGGTSTIGAVTITQNSNVAISGGAALLTVTGIANVNPQIVVQSGTLAIDNGGRVTGTLAGVNLGQSGTGTLLITNGTFSLTQGANLGVNAGDLGLAVISGPNSFWNADGGVTVGVNGSGTMSITGGARVIAPGFNTIGQNDNSRGAVTVSGTGSTWDSVGNSIFVANGTNSVGSLRVEDGAFVAGSNLFIAYSEGSNGTVIQTGGTVTAPQLDFVSGTGTYRLEGGVLQSAYMQQYTPNVYTFELASGTIQAYAGNPLTAALNATLRAGTISTIDTNGVAGTWSGTLSGAGGLNKAGAGTLTLSANNTYSGNTTLTRGGLLFGSNTAIGTGTLTVLGNTTFGATGGARTIANNIVIDPGFTGTVTGNAISLTLNGTISGAGGLAKVNSGTLTLSGSNTYSGNTTLNAGALFLGHDKAIGTGTLALTGNSSLTAVGAARTLANNAVINTGVTGTVTGSAALTLNGTIGGAGSLIKSGTATLTLGGANTYTGTTTLTAGALVAANAGAFGNSTLLVFNGGTLQGNGAAYTFSNSVSIAANTAFSGPSDLTFSNTVNLGVTTRVLTVSNGTTAFSGTVGGTAGLSKAGTGTLLLSGTNNLYTGKTTISSGTLAINAPGSLGNPGAANAAIDIGATSTTAALRYVGTTGTIARTIALAGSTGGAILDASGAGPLTLSGSIAGTAAGVKTLTLTGTSTALNTISGTISNGTGTVSLLKSGGGTWRLSAPNTYTGSTTIAEGRLIVSNTNSLGTATSAVALGGASTSGTLSYSGNSAAYTRGFTVNAGGGGVDVATAGQTLTIGTNGVNTAGRFTVSGPGNTTFTATITGAGSLGKTGTGLLTITGSNNYTGGTRVSSGTLTAQHNNALGTGSIVVDGGVFYVDTGVAVSNAVILSGGEYQRTLGGSLVDAVNASSDLAGGIDTVARLAAGTLSAPATLETSFTLNSGAPRDGALRSDIYNFQGTGSDLFVLELSITSTAPDAFLGWLDEDTNLWVNAVEGNSLNNASEAQQNFAGSFAQFQAAPGNGTDLSTYLGAWGSTTSGGVTTVWAVLDHNSAFATIPEPGTVALLALGALGLLRRRR